MGLASKVQAAGSATSGSGARPSMASASTAQPAASAFPQINQGPGGPSNGPSRPQGMPQASFPGQQIGQGQSAFPGQQSSSARPSYPSPGNPFAGQQALQQRPGQPPMHSPSFSGQQQQQQGFPGGQTGQGAQPSYTPGQPQQMGQQPGQSAQQSYLPGQPQQMGQQTRPPQPSSAFGQGPSSSMQAALQTKIQNMIRTNRLETFYPPNKLQAVVQRLGQIDWK